MKKIKDEKLIALAEGASLPTAEEMSLLEENQQQTDELEELQLLFADIKQLPECRIPDAKLNKLLAGVHQGIAENERRKKYFGFNLIANPVLQFALAATFIFTIGLLLFNHSESLIDPEVIIQNSELLYSDTYNQYLQLAIADQAELLESITNSYFQNEENISGYSDNYNYYKSTYNIDDSEIDQIIDELKK